MTKAYRVVHKQIDGLIEDRENGWPTLHLEMHPVGTELEPEEQSRELHLSILKTKTILSEEGLQELIDFLKEKP